MSAIPPTSAGAAFLKTDLLESQKPPRLRVMKYTGHLQEACCVFGTLDCFVEARLRLQASFPAVEFTFAWVPGLTNKADGLSRGFFGWDSAAHSLHDR